MKENNEKDEKQLTGEKERKELTPQQIQKRKKMLVYPLMVLVFIGIMWLIFAPSGDKEESKPDGFNPELPVPKDETIIDDKRTAYEQEALRNKEESKRRNLQDFAFMIGEEKQASGDKEFPLGIVQTDVPEVPQNGSSSRKTIQASTHAYRDVNRQLNSWYEQPDASANKESQTEMESRIEELERKLTEAEAAKSAEDRQLDLIEKSYQIAAKYSPNEQAPSDGQQIQTSTNSLTEKVIPKPVSQVRHNVVSLLAAPMDNDEFMEQYAKPRNMEFITAAGNEEVKEKNSIRACIYQSVTLSDGKELQLRLLEPMRVGNILIPVNTVLRGSAKIGGERLMITITSIQYADNIIPVDMSVYDMDGMQGIFVPNSAELNAAKEIAANMGTQMGSSITITDDAGSQLAADLGRSAIQGASQYISKKMREVKVTLKANYKVLLLPKA